MAKFRTCQQVNFQIASNGGCWFGSGFSRGKRRVIKNERSSLFLLRIIWCEWRKGCNFVGG